MLQGMVQCLARLQTMSPQKLYKIRKKKKTDENRGLLSDRGLLQKEPFVSKVEIMVFVQIR